MMQGPIDVIAEHDLVGCVMHLGGSQPTKFFSLCSDLSIQNGPCRPPFRRGRGTRASSAVADVLKTKKSEKFRQLKDRLAIPFKLKLLWSRLARP